jgi:hypothetical protein
VVEIAAETELVITERPQGVSLDTEPKSTPAAETSGEIGPEHATTIQPAMSEHGRDPVQESVVQAPQPTSEPVILLASEYPPPESGQDPIGPNVV